MMKNVIDHKVKMKWDNEAVLDHAINTTKRRTIMDIARNCKELGLSIDVIARATKLSIEEIEKL